MKRRIAIVGGGSVAWTPRIVRDMLMNEEISDSVFVLYDIDRAAADRAHAFCTKLAEALGSGAEFVATDDPSVAFPGADYVIITISTGGLDAMSHDLAIPEEYDIFHTVGDTSGPGGWARLIRNFGTFVTLAEQINTHAYGAFVLNYTNPMSTLTDVLSRLCHGPVVGLCHGLFENIDILCKLHGIEDESDLSISYAGLNHFFWITEARTATENIYASLHDRIQNDTLTEIIADLSRANATDSDSQPKVRELATALFRETEIMPYFGDRHTCEFFPYYITSQETMERFRLVRTSIDERRDAAKRRTQFMLDAINDGISEDFLRPSRETAADIIAAHTTGRAFIDVGNVPNIGQVANLEPGIVVETAVRVDRNGVSPIAFGNIPESVIGFIEPYAASYRTLVDACFLEDRDLALHALRLDPVCSHLTTDRVREMGSRLLEAQTDFIDIF